MCDATTGIRANEPVRTELSDGLPRKALLRPDEVAAFLSVSERTIYRWHQQRLIEGIRVKKSLRIPRESIVKLLEQSLISD